MSLVEIYCVPPPYLLGVEVHLLQGTVEISIHEFGSRPQSVPVRPIHIFLRSLLPFDLLL